MFIIVLMKTCARVQEKSGLQNTKGGIASKLVIVIKSCPSLPCRSPIILLILILPSINADL